MKICVLGGFGVIGRAIVEQLLTQTDVHIVAADRQVLPVAEVFGEHAARVEAVAVDVDRPASLAAALADCRLAVSCIGPFYRHGVAVARAILENGCHGVDLCNDAVASSGILALDAVARARGLSYVTGMGCSPGLSNLFAMRAASDMDRCTSVHINLVALLDGQSGRAQMDHLMSLATEDVPVFRHRMLTRVKPFSEPEYENFPHPIGRQRVSQTGHPEVFTLPDYLDVEEVWVKGALLPSWVERILWMTSTTGVARDEVPRMKIANGLHRLYHLGFATRHRKNMALRVRVTGWKKGTPLTVSISAVDALSRLTALPVTVAAVALMDGEIQTPGVFPPEGCIREDHALLHLARLGLVFHQEERYLL